MKRRRKHPRHDGRHAVRRAASGAMIDLLEPRRLLTGASLSAADASVFEGNRGARNLVFTVTLSTKSTAPVSVDYSTSAGTAFPTSDYRDRSGTIRFLPGQLKKTIAIPAIGDRTIENDETFT